MSNCYNCKNYSASYDRCRIGYCNYPEAAVVEAKGGNMTWGDSIRAMTDEELAIEETAKGGCPHDCETPDDMDTDCVRCWLDWLKQEVDNG